MAVQQNKKSPSRRDMRRSHDKLSCPTLSTGKVNEANDERHLRHHISASGYYRGKQYIEQPTVSDEDTGDEE